MPYIIEEQIIGIDDGWYPVGEDTFSVRTEAEQVMVSLQEGVEDVARYRVRKVENDVHPV